MLSGYYMPKRPHSVDLFIAASLLTIAPAWTQSNSPAQQSTDRTAQPMSAGPAQSTAATEAYTADRQFLVRLLSVPKPIPYEKYFSVTVGVYDANNPARRLSDVQLAVVAGMSHGLAQGFAHTMQSAPKIEARDGVATVSGLYFHMMGSWTMEVTVRMRDEESAAYFQLPCCEH
jgi:hypothetical protein